MYVRDSGGAGVIESGVRVTMVDAKGVVRSVAHRSPFWVRSVVGQPTGECLRSSVILTQITETETENFPVAYIRSVISHKLFFSRHVRTLLWEKK